MAIIEQSYLGVGKMWIEKIGSTTGLKDAGEVDEITVAHSSDKKTLPSHRKLGGGNRNSINRTTGVELAVKFRDFSPENMAIGLFGSTSSVVSGSILDESHVARHDALLKLDYPGATNINVQDQSGGAGTTYTKGTDYTVESGGIVILSTGTITDGQTIYVDYNNPGIDIVQALVNSGDDYHIYFDGLNEAQGGDPFTGEFFRAKSALAENLALISDDYGEMGLTFEVLQDESRPTGKSQYYEIVKKTAA